MLNVSKKCVFRPALYTKIIMCCECVSVPTLKRTVNSIFLVPLYTKVIRFDVCGCTYHKRTVNSTFPSPLYTKVIVFVRCVHVNSSVRRCLLK